MIGLWVLLVLAFLSGSVHAQDWTAGVAMRTLERPAHETLIAVVEDSEAGLVPFKTDGCSGGLSNAWQVVADRFPEFAKTHQSMPPWEMCCIKHDRAYHNAGGALDATGSFEARLNADLLLKTCVISTGTDRAGSLASIYRANPDQIVDAYEGIAEAMFLALRIGGAPCSGLPWRWGYGYPDCSVLTAVFD